MIKPQINDKKTPPCLTKIGDELCTGCAACANSCPKNAIEIRLSTQGFYRPVLQENTCDNCGLCLKKCPVIESIHLKCVESRQQNKPLVYAAWATDEHVHQTSSSGGVFSELARYVLQQGGVVCGCEWGKNLTPRHVIVKDWESVTHLRGAKYIPSFIGNNYYRKIIDLAQKGTLVLFCGTPCQVSGLSLITPKSARTNLVLVDLVCHGVPSIISFWRYLDWKFDSRKQVISFSFRNKELSVQTICAITSKGQKYLSPAGKDAWYRLAMIQHLFLQSSCFSCCFGSKKRSGDITLGDFWGIPEKWHNDLGDSLILANTKKGQEIIARLHNNGQLKLKENNIETLQHGRLHGSEYSRPRFRIVANRLLADGWSFSWIYYSYYLPINFIQRTIGFLQRRSLSVIKTVSKKIRH